MLKLSPTFLKTSTHAFHSSLQISKCSVVRGAGNRLLIVKFNVLHAFWVISADCLFANSTQKEVSCERFGDAGGHRQRLKMRSLKSCETVVSVFAVWAVVSYY